MEKMDECIRNKMACHLQHHDALSHMMAAAKHGEQNDIEEIKVPCIVNDLRLSLSLSLSQLFKISLLNYTLWQKKLKGSGEYALMGLQH